MALSRILYTWFQIYHLPHMRISGTTIWIAKIPKISMIPTESTCFHGFQNCTWFLRLQLILRILNKAYTDSRSGTTFGVSPHTTPNVKHNSAFSKRWISCGASTAWPALLQIPVCAVLFIVYSSELKLSTNYNKCSTLI